MTKKEQILNETIKRTVNNILRESQERDRRINMIIEQVIEENIAMLNEAGKGKGKTKKKKNNKEIANKKRAVIKWLKSDTIDAAAIRRRLEGEPEDQEEEDSKRSYFMKKVNQSYGKDFTEKEINTLYSIKNELTK